MLVIWSGREEVRLGREERGPEICDAVDGVPESVFRIQLETVESEVACDERRAGLGWCRAVSGFRDVSKCDGAQE